MANDNDQKLAANYMGAIAHALGGRRGRHREFMEKVELILSAYAPNAFTLMQFVGEVRRTGRPVLWFHIDSETPNFPHVGLVAKSGDQVYTVEMCLLWVPEKGGRATLIPDNFETGSFRFDDKLNLRHSRQTPIAEFNAATPGMVRAYSRLRELEHEQLLNGDSFVLPQLVRQAA